MYRNGRFHGKGSLITKDGEVYAGEFEAGKLVEGTLQYMDGSRYGASWYKKWADAVDLPCIHGNFLCVHAASLLTFCVISTHTLHVTCITIEGTSAFICDAF